jgi:MarR family transcriptional regulator, temperature-dependent positive regulator of motility
MGRASEAGAELPSPLHALHRTAQRADSLFARHGGAGNITPRQFAVLEAVSLADGMSQVQIMKATGIDRSSTAELVTRLVSLKWLHRHRSKRDNRSYVVGLTQAGRERLAMGRSAADAANQALLSVLPPTQRRGFLRSLAKVAGL